MKKFILILSFFALVLFVLQRLPSTSPYLKDGERALRSFLYEFDIEVEGVPEALRRDVAARIPQQHSWLWWLWNKNEVRLSLLGIAGLADVQIHTCELWKLNCYRMQAKIRSPGFLAVLEDRHWLMDENGQMIAPLEAREVHQPAFRALPQVTGVGELKKSSELSFGRTSYVSQFLRLIERESELQVTRVHMGLANELRVRFQGHDFDVIFRSDTNSFLHIEKELRRLLAILEQAQGQTHHFALIDLAFDQQAVIRVKPESKEALQPKKSSNTQKQK